MENLEDASLTDLKDFFETTMIDNIEFRRKVLEEICNRVYRDGYRDGYLEAEDDFNNH